MFQIASFKIICTDSTEILFSKLGPAGLNFHLPKRFSLFLTVEVGGGGGGSNKHCFLTFFHFFLIFFQCCLKLENDVMI